MILLNCAFNKKIGKVPMYETFGNMDPSSIFRGVGGFFVSLFVLFIVILAIVLAVRCNPDNKLAYGIIALLFSEIYLIQFFIRKYLIKEKNYCTAIF
jgi:hypothetical protein